jgi:modulator of FtsH protease
MQEAQLAWHDFNVSVVAAAAALLGLLFVALSLHLRALTAARNAELRSIAQTIFLGYVVSLGMGFVGLVPQPLGPYGFELLLLFVAAIVPFAIAARTGFRATGVGYGRRTTVVQFALGIAMFVVSIAASLALAAGDVRALFVIGAIPVLGLLWGVFNTYELLFRIASANDTELPR